ncbi:universal stress protein UspA-like protein [Natrinema pellirubrum DSM 15624]|uniref:Universal stress protein UspA-like protein n=1 Tax=Natrinema pellirubrum (strain DSM 15624 / CIP 106293 / JCM 10476 / NCIMB 786 / 157) TaxID=797303 RepID=L0JNG8_NATP1|nr:universal stress protein [Natrinema pellirubrum]AGB32378.1 universal stress protein UspA-like protein [Natrinema pellirubrum DSM 15624]ELY73960.1 universal stress protein UspA-like protein [Natrinema pellirubrum DSM 15624]
MYDSVLVPTDGSDHAARVAGHALGLARWFDATVHVVSVVDVSAAGGVFDAGGVSPAFVERLEDEAAAAIERIETMTDTDRVRSAVLKGSPAATILEYADENDVDLIAMGTHGRTGVNRYLTGSVTERVVRQSDVPVMTARVTERSEWAGGYDEILLPTDGSEPAAAAVDHALAIATRADATVHVVSVVDVSTVAGRPTIVAPNDILAQFESDAETAVETVAATVRDAGLDVETHVRKDIPSQGLLEYVDDHDIDLVTMGTHGRTGFDRVLLGSTTERFVRRAPVPVLAVHPTAGSEPN